MDQNIKQQIVETLNGTTNVLVTVSSDPTVDELAACIGLTLVLNKLDKHATAVFSGKVPSTLEFLKPDETLENNTDSLRDFIIALDKSKADKLRYKVEDTVVKIFITPYKTSISDKDLDFSQGDFNVDVVLALGVHKREELDKAIVAHGRILHDATVICVNNQQVSNLGVYNWQDAEASSLCEMIVDLAETIKPDNFDAQMATALLTGIVSETERFSNEKTSPRTMSLSAKLMAAGANQQLVASKLQTVLSPNDVAKGTEPEVEKDEVDGDTLRIAHNPDEDESEEEQAAKKLDDGESADKTNDEDPFSEEPLQKPETPARETRLEPDETPTPADNTPKIGNVKTEPTESTPSAPAPTSSTNTMKPGGSRLTYEPPTMGGTLTANSRPEGLDPSTDGMSLPTPVNAQTLSHGASRVGQDTSDKPLMDDETLSHIEKSVGSDHAEEPQNDVTPADAPDIDALQEAVDAAAAANEDENKDRLEPLVASGASPLDLNVQSSASASPVPTAQPVTNQDAFNTVNPGPPAMEPLPTVPAQPAMPPAPAQPTMPPQAPQTPAPSAADVMSGVAQAAPDQMAPPAAPAAQPSPSMDMPSQLVPPDPGLPPEQTASGTPDPLAPPPVPPPFTGGFPPAGQPPQPPQYPQPPTPGV